MEEKYQLAMAAIKQEQGDKRPVGHPRTAAGRVAEALGISTESVRRNGLDIPCQLEAWCARYARMRYNRSLLEDKVNEFKRELLKSALQEAKQNKRQAALNLGIHRNTIARQMQELGLTKAGTRTNRAGVRKPPAKESAILDAAASLEAIGRKRRAI